MDNDILWSKPIVLRKNHHKIFIMTPFILEKLQSLVDNDFIWPRLINNKTMGTFQTCLLTIREFFFSEKNLKGEIFTIESSQNIHYDTFTY